MSRRQIIVPIEVFALLSHAVGSVLCFAKIHPPMERMQGIGSEQSHKRYDTPADHTGSEDDDEVRDLLESVAQKNFPQTADSYEKTMWSIVYCPDKRCADFYFAENYAHSYELMLSEKDSFLKR